MAGEHAGRSIIEQLWEQLDKQYAKLKELHAETGGFTEDNLGKAARTVKGSEMAVAYLQTQGKVLGLAVAVGTILYPYDSVPDRIAKVRAELPQRWADEYGDEEDEED